MSVYLR